MISVRLFLLSFSCACFLVEGVSLALEAKTSSAEVIDVDISLRVIRGSEVFTSAHEVLVKFTNNTMVEATIKEVRLDTVPSWMLIAPPNIEACLDLDPIAANSTKHCKVELPHIAGWKEWLSLTTLTFYPGEYPLVLTATIKTYAGKEKTFEEEVMIRLVPPLSSLLRGGLLGSLLMAVFVVTRRRRGVMKGRSEEALRREVGTLVDFLGLLIFGAVVTVIAILVLQRIGEVDLPISVEIKDYLGAFVVGVLSLRIGDNLYELMFGEVGDRGAESTKEDEVQAGARLEPGAASD